MWYRPSIAVEPNMRGEDEGAPPDTVAGTLEVLLEQVRRVFDPSGCAFLMVEGRRIHPAAAWFSSPEVAGAMGPVLEREYDLRRPGLTETAYDRGTPVILRSIEDWHGAQAMRARLAERLDPAAVEVAWGWYRRSCLVACPVRTAAGRVLGVLAIALDNTQEVGSRDVRAMTALAGLAAVALERSELLHREAVRSHEEALLGEAAREMPASLELGAVQVAIVHQALRVTGAAHAELRSVESPAESDRVLAAEGEPPAGPAECTEVPIGLGPRTFARLLVTAPEGASLGPDATRRLHALAPLAAGAVANALDFERERRVARALARGFVPSAADRIPEVEIGLVYAPAEVAGGGGDFFGVWPLGGGAIAVLVGDVSGKGIEVSATSAMARFFAEARMWDHCDPARALADVNALLCARGRDVGFATAFLAVLHGDRLSFAGAGHLPPLVRRADGRLEELRPSGMPLGVEADAGWTVEETPFGADDLLLAATDGLVEARRGHELFGEERVRDLVAGEAGAGSPQALVDRLHAEVLGWSDHVGDDIVVLGLRRR